MQHLAALLIATFAALPSAADTINIPGDAASLAEAAAIAQPGDEIVLGPGEFSADILFGVGTITIRGAGPELTTIVPEQDGVQRAMLYWDVSRQPLNSPIDVTIADLTISGFAGVNPDSGQDQYETPLEISGPFSAPDGAVTLTNVHVRDAIRPFNGTVDLQSLDTVIVEDCVFENMDSEAGALYIVNIGEALVARSRFISCRGFGAPLTISGAAFATVDTCLFTGTGSRSRFGSAALRILGPFGGGGGQAVIMDSSFGSIGPSVDEPMGTSAVVDLVNIDAEYIRCAFAATDMLAAEDRGSTFTFLNCVGPQVPAEFAETNIIATPGFTDAGDPGADGLWGSADDNPGDLTPAPGSNLLDAGGGDFANLFDADVLGNLRLVDLPGVPNDSFDGSNYPYQDIGAIEVQKDCPADVNSDGQLDSADFFAWVNAFTGQGNPVCDVNGDLRCTSADFFAWVAAFGAGC